MEALIEQVRQKLKNAGIPTDYDRPSSDAWRSLKDEIAGARRCASQKNWPLI